MVVLMIAAFLVIVVYAFSRWYYCELVPDKTGVARTPEVYTTAHTWWSAIPVLVLAGILAVVWGMSDRTRPTSKGMRLHMYRLNRHRLEAFLFNSDKDPFNNDYQVRGEYQEALEYYANNPVAKDEFKRKEGNMGAPKDNKNAVKGLAPKKTSYRLTMTVDNMGLLRSIAKNEKTSVAQVLEKALLAKYPDIFSNKF